MTYDTRDAIQADGPGIMAKLVVRSGDAFTVRFSTMRSLADALYDTGFTHSHFVAFGPSGGRQIFFQSGLLVARVKTKGDERGPRAGVAHMSIGITDGKGSQWFNDVAKLSGEGRIAAKAMTTADKFNPIDHDKNPQRFVLIRCNETPEESMAAGDAWAARTHFNFPQGIVIDDFIA